MRIYAGAIPRALLRGWDLPSAILGMGLVTLAYTFIGGLRSVVWADALQWAVYIAGGACALWVALLMAGILAAAMSTIGSSISALASSTTQDLYAPWAGKTTQAEGPHLLRVGRWCSLGWGLLLTGCALAFHFAAGSRDTPVVVMALSIASVTYGALLGSFVLALWRSGPGARVQGWQVVAGAALSMALMAGLVFGLPGRVAFVWFVPLGTGLTVAAALALQALATMRAHRARP